MQYVIGQIMGLLVGVITIILPTLKKKWQMLVATIGSNLLLVLNLTLIGQFGSGAYLCIVAVVQGILSLVHLFRKTRVTTGEQMIFLALYVILGFWGIFTAPGFVPELSYKNLLELLPIFGAVLLTFSIFTLDEQTSRKYLLANLAVWTLYYALIGSSAVFSGLAGIITTSTALYKYRSRT